MEKTSKSEKKRQASSVQGLGEKLVSLTEEQLRKIELPENISDAVALARTIKKRGGLKRQLQYIGTLMRKTDTKPIQEAVQDLEEGNRRAAELHKKVEHWRDELIGGNDALVEDILHVLETAEREPLTDLVRKAREEKEKKNSSPAPARSLFRYLHKAAELARANKDG